MVKNDKKVSSRNYYIVLIVCTLTIALSLYVRSFIINYKANKVNTSVFDKVQSIKLNELDFTIPETKEAILYVSYKGNESIMNMENKLYKTIKKSSLLDKVIYIDVSDYTSGNEYLTILKEKFPEFKNELNASPLIIYIKDGVAVDTISSDLKMIDSSSFTNFVKNNSIEE